MAAPQKFNGGIGLPSQLPAGARGGTVLYLRAIFSFYNPSATADSPPLASEKFRVIAFKKAPKSSGYWKPVSSTGSFEKQITQFVIVARVDFGSDHLKRKNDRLHRIGAPNIHHRFFVRPIDFISTRPSATLFTFGRENANGNFDLVTSVAQRQFAARDYHGGGLLCESSKLGQIGFDLLGQFWAGS
jgi:hypothetical protein